MYQQQRSTPKLAAALILSGAISISVPAHAATWTATGSPTIAVASLTLLNNGKVLAVSSGQFTTAELYNPATGIWVQTGSLAIDHYGWGGGTTTLLANGKVLVEGLGYYDLTNSSELYDPVTEQWNTTGSLTTARLYDGLTLTQLANSKVLALGGTDAEFNPLYSAELYDPATGFWTATGSLASGRANHTATLLSNGKVLIAGGLSSVVAPQQYPTSTTLYDPATGQWSLTGSLTIGRSSHTATLLPNGKVLVAGGYYVGSGTGQCPTVAELYDPATGRWTQTGALITGRRYHTATLLANGKVLVAGGHNGNATVNSAEVFDVTTGTWSNTATMATARSGHTATLLPNGKVLVAGGRDGPAYVNSAELYTPDAAATTTTLTSSLNPAIVNQNVVFTAKVAAPPVPTGTVTFKVDGATKAATSLSGGQTTYATNALALGNRLIRAEYAGNSTWAASAAQLTQTVTTGADFVITNLSLNPLTPAVNQAFTVRGVVKNTSTVTGAAGNLSLWLDKAAAVGCNVASDKVIAIGTLSAGASKAFSVNLTAAAASGNKTLRAFVDSACATVETSESNNQVTKTYTVGAPDLTVTSITLTPAAPVTGATFTARVVVKNQGANPISSSFLDLWLDKSTTQNCGAASAYWATIDALAAGASQTITFSSSFTDTAGTKTLRAYADSWCETADANRSNNQLTKTYTAVSASADFVVNGVMLIPSSPIANNSTFTAIAIVTNQGTAAGNAGNLTVWANQATIQSCNATGDKVVAVGTLAAGATSAFTVTGLSAGAAGAKKFRAFVDSACATSEANEVNNQLMQSYTVQ